MDSNKKNYYKKPAKDSWQTAKKIIICFFFGMILVFCSVLIPAERYRELQTAKADSLKGQQRAVPLLQTKHSK